MIREAVPDDSEQIAGLITELGYATTADEMRHRFATIMRDTDRHTLVFERDGRLLALVGLMRHRYYERDGFGLQIAALIVTADARGSGIGAELVEAAERWGRENGCERVWLSSGLDRHDAHRFYRRAGYADTGLRFVKELA